MAIIPLVSLSCHARLERSFITQSTGNGPTDSADMMMIVMESTRLVHSTPMGQFMWVSDVGDH